MSLSSLSVKSALVATVASVFLSVSSAGAATLNFDGAFTGGGGGHLEDGLQFDDVRIVNGNCGVANPCAALNDNETTTVTSQILAGTFTLTSFWFELLGRGQGQTKNALYVMTDLLTSPYLFSVNDYGHNNGGSTIDLTLLSGFSGVTWVSFYTLDGGNVRIDDIGVKTDDPAPVPLPAAGGLLALGLAGLSLLRRRAVA